MRLEKPRRSSYAVRPSSVGVTDLYQTVKFHFEEEERPQSESDRKGKGETKFFRLSRDFFLPLVSWFFFISFSRRTET